MSTIKREATDFAHLEDCVPSWRDKPYGYIATLAGMSRTRVKRAIRWSLQNRRDIITVTPTSTPGENTLDIVSTPTARSMRPIRWNTKYIRTRTRNHIQYALEQHAACEPDPVDAAIMENLAENAKESADKLERDLRLMEMLVAKRTAALSTSAV